MLFLNRVECPIRTEGQSESAILSFSKVYQDAAQLLKHAQDALGNFGEQLSGDYDFQQHGGSVSGGGPEQTVIGQLLGLVEGNTNHHDSDGVVVGEGAIPPLNLPVLDALYPIIQNDNVRNSLPVVHSGVNNLQRGGGV